MRMWRAILVVVLVTSVAGTSGCFLKKKKPAVPAPQAQAPTVTPEPAPATTETPPPETEAKPAPEVPAETTPPPPAPAPKPKPKRNHAAKKPAPPPAPAPEKPSRTVVEQGGTKPPSGPQLSANIPKDTVIHQKLNTAQLLEATEYNLKSITRTLSTDEQAMVQHIRSYMQQSHDATKDGDTERAYNLALKAHLLSDELVKP